ncbi:unnamed protein product [Paramecium octaurelia]|uniref:Regulator of chromosome condensation n=1 Tax=Paramecium octaurelia TaxID=43137 RepID=A0A8S1SF69_PAROT|nr:unnamed protein product [Paramecium octaurelia]
MTSDQNLDYFTTDLYVMGDNKETQCGIDNQDYVYKLTKINLPMVIREIACGLEHSLLVTNEGLVYAFGSNSKGQLGVQNISVACSPILVQGISELNCIKIAAGEYHSCLLTDENQAYQWGNNIVKPQFIRQASNIKCGLNFTIFQDDSLYLYKNQVLQPLKIKSQISEFACSAYNLFYLDNNNTLYLHPETKLIDHVFNIFSGYHLSLLTDENKLYYYLDKQLIQVNVQPNKIDSSFGKEWAIVLDDNNKAIIINLKNQQQKQQEFVFHSISSGVNHLILIGNITKGQIQNQELEESVQIGEDEEEDDSILEGDGMSPIITQKTQQDQLMNTQQNNTFSFSIRKDLQLFNSIKANHKETQTDDNLYNKLKNENEELRTILLQQRKNLEIQIQFQKTLQDQMSRLTQENHMLKLGQNKNQLLNLIKQKEQNLKNLIDEFYQKQREFLQNKK